MPGIKKCTLRFAVCRVPGSERIYPHNLMIESFPIAPKTTVEALFEHIQQPPKEAHLRFCKYLFKKTYIVDIFEPSGP